MKPDVSGSITRATIRSPLTPLFLLTALAVGLVALLSIPREEEPQISVPMVDMIVQADARREGRQNMVFTAPDRDAELARRTLEDARSEIGFEELEVNRDVAKVSVVGVGMRSHTGVAKAMFQALSAKGINIAVIATSEIKISVLIDAAYTELAVRALHTAYGLDAE